jgi:hypothetical protein
MSETPYNEHPTNAELELAEIKRMDERKPAGVPEAKITIFIEIGDRIKKIEIPQARYIDIENRYKDESSNGIQFSLKCEPQYHLDRNYYLTEEIRSVEANDRLRVNAWPAARNDPSNWSV